MKKLLFTIIIVFVQLSIYGQDSKDPVKIKSNPIIYTEFFGGISGGNSKGFAFGLELNYQNKKDLFTFRTLYIIDTNKDVNFFEALAIIPIFIGGDSMNEYSIMYGKRFIKDGSAISISVGISSNLKKYKVITNDVKIRKRESYIGIPFEFNIQGFKKSKDRFRILYGLIPIGKRTSFGKSIGVKLFGNIGKSSYIGLGINMGLGWHKKY